MCGGSKGRQGRGIGVRFGVIFLLGPTAAGKSRLAMTLAEQTGAEICSVDAFQIYRGLNIGTGKPTKEEQAKIPHHLIDLVEPVEQFTVANYVRAAEKVLQDLRKRKASSIWVGGTGLYHRALTKGLSRAPKTELAVAEELEKRTTEELAKEVGEVDPVWGGTADLKNRRRLIRALAVWRQTGKTMSAWHGHETVKGPMADVGAWCLFPNLDVLIHVIRDRVKGMFDSGWVEEVRELMRRPSWAGCPGSRAIGYSEVAELVQGRSDRQETCDKIVSATRAYAKRQLTWFRGIPKVRAIEIDPREPLPKAGVEMLLRALGGGGIS
jgi:tRNA dimethylallyltransferase